MRDAGLAPEQIDYINAHASSTQLNDANEARCIETVFGAYAKRVPVSGTKAYFAHPLGATGAIETALCALALEHQSIPPTLNWSEADPACCGLDVAPNHGRQQPLHHVMCNAFGFGGINSCLILGKMQEAAV